MKVDLNKVAATSLFSGFGNSSVVDFTTTVAGQNLASGGFIGPIRASTPLNNTNSISSIKVKYDGLDSFWRLVPGAISVDYPNANLPYYQIESFSYYTGGNLVVDTYISNQAPFTVAIPAMTIRCHANLFIAPF